MTIVREQKKRPLRFFAMLLKTILTLTKKIFNKIWRYTFLGIQGHGKGHKVKQPKTIIFHFLVTDLESLVNFH